MGPRRFFSFSISSLLSSVYSLPPEFTLSCKGFSLIWGLVKCAWVLCYLPLKPCCPLLKPLSLLNTTLQLYTTAKRIYTNILLKNWKLFYSRSLQIRDYIHKYTQIYITALIYSCGRYTAVYTVVFTYSCVYSCNKL